MSDQYARRFELKGKIAEEYLLSLAQRTFLTDWCYPSPKLPSGKELCDLLVVFGDTAIIWQVKDLKLDEEGKYSQSEVDKNFRQLAGARRMMFDVKVPIDLSNPRRGTERFDPSQISKVHLISAFLGEPEDYQALFGHAKEHAVHVFTREFTEIILDECDTISDFTQYLQTKKDALFGAPNTMQVIVSGGEEELLALYIRNKRALPMFGEGAILVTVDDGHWEDLRANPDFQAKKEEDKISYLWDTIIDGAHQSGDPSYEIVAREMARFNRFERRVLSQAMLEAWKKAESIHEQGMTVFRRTVVCGNMTICFTFADSSAISHETRKAQLEAYCFIARGHPNFRSNHKVIGIATECKMTDSGIYDVAFLDMPEWTKEDDDKATKLKAIIKSGNNVSIRAMRASEYPTKDETITEP